MWLDTARTSPASGAAGQSIAGITDVSGNGYHLTQGTTGSRPVTEIVNGGLRLLFDGAADFMSSVTPINFGGADAVTLSAAVNKASDLNSTRVIAEIGNTTTTNGSAALFGPRVSGEPGYAWHSRGTTNSETGVATGYAAPHKGVITGIGDISDDISRLRIAGTQVSSVATDQGTGGYATNTLHVGSRGGTMWFFNGSMGNLIGMPSVATANQLRIIRAIGDRTIP